MRERVSASTTAHEQGAGPGGPLPPTYAHLPEEYRIVLGCTCAVLQMHVPVRGDILLVCLQAPGDEVIFRLSFHTSFVLGEEVSAPLSTAEY
jgi:hypothetical protein